MHVRIEAVYDEATELYFAEVYMPGEAEKPRFVSRPRFASREEAMDEMLALMEEGFKQPAKVLKPN